MLYGAHQERNWSRNILKFKGYMWNTLMIWPYTSTLSLKQYHAFCLSALIIIISYIKPNSLVRCSVFLWIQHHFLPMPTVTLLWPCTQFSGSPKVSHSHLSLISYILFFYAKKKIWCFLSFLDNSSEASALFGILSGSLQAGSNVLYKSYLYDITNQTVPNFLFTLE